MHASAPLSLPPTISNIIVHDTTKHFQSKFGNDFHIKPFDTKFGLKNNQIYS